MNPIRGAIAAVLVFLILGLSMYVYLNKDTLLTNTTELEYPDGCVEEYVNGVLVSDVCEEGRVMADDKDNNAPPSGVVFPPVWVDLCGNYTRTS